MNIKSFLLFVGGIAIGGLTGVLGTKGYFQKKYFKEYERDKLALEEYYRRTDEYLRSCTDTDSYENANEVNPAGGRMSKEERSAFKEQLNKAYGAEPINYAGMYREKGGYTETKLLEGQHPLDQGEEGEEEEDSFIETTPEEEVFDEYQKNKNKLPKIISLETYSNLPPTIDQEILYFYSYDEVLCEENEEPVEEPERLVGDALTKYGFIDNEERVIFVMNYELNTCYEIQKVDASRSDSY